jgi:hypothetical protein
MIDKMSFGDANSIVANAGASTTLDNVIDLGAGKTYWPDDTTHYADIAPGTRVGLLMAIATALAGSGAVLTVKVYNHTAATSIDSGHIIYESPPFTVPADGVAAGNYLVRAPFPLGRITKRYVGVVVEVATQNLTAGAVDAALTDEFEFNSANDAMSIVS